MGIGEIIGGALIQFGVNRTGDAALQAAKERRQGALARRNEWMDRYIGKLMRRTADLERRITAIEQEREQVEANLEDPDFWSTFEQAGLAGARTGDEMKQDLLARAVVERLAAAPGSTSALASARAVEMVSHLASQHLVLLGLAALVYEMRPSLSVPKPPKRGNAHDLKAENRRVQEEMNVQTARYVEWLRERLQHVQVQPTPPTEITTAHLISVAAIIFDRATERDLFQTLSPWRDTDERLFVSFRATQPLSELLKERDVGWTLRELWRTWLQHVTLTPAGLLLGIAVVDFRAKSSTAIDFDRSTYATAGRIDRSRIWDGEHLEDRFMDALGREIQDRIERGVGVWRKIFERT